MTTNSGTRITWPCSAGVGCVIDSAAMAKFVGDDIAFRANMFTLDMANPLVAARYLGRTVGRGESPIRRAAKLIGLTTQSKAICRDVATRVGAILDLGPQVRQALGQCDEHWNGKGAVLLTSRYRSVQRKRRF